MTNFNGNINEIRDLIGENLAQTSNSNDRFFDEVETNYFSSNFDKYVLRTEFTRDADRILYSKAFRRLEHKAQVYSNKKGDHYRTRLTHTLEVTQIARSIARNLNLNENLTEAISLGHDIGHTPFGHAGEEVLDGIMRGEDDLGGKLNFRIDYGGFKHNFNCLKIVEIVEKRDKKTGLNLTWQTLDGILKHTKIFKNGKKWDLKRFTRDVNKYNDILNYSYFDDTSFPKYDFPLTLEGQIVAISDEIAQREHDLDDSIRNGALFRFEEMSRIIINMVEEIKRELHHDDSGYDLFIEFYNKILNMGEIENTIQWKQVTSIIISYFIIDITENTLKSLSDYAPNFEKIIDVNENNNDKYIVKKIIRFSKSAQKVNDKIDNFIEKRIINSFDVNRFDGKGKFILRQLFKAYYENPRQMPKKQLVVLVKNIQRIIKDYPQLREEFDDVPIDFTELFRIDENYIDLNNLQPMLNILKLDNYSEFSENKSVNFELSELLNKISNIMNFNIQEEYKNNFDTEEIMHKLFENLFIFCNLKTDNEINDLTNKNCKNFLLLIKGWNELHYVYLSTICEYISQMTDDYAIKEYHELYLE